MRRQTHIHPWILALAALPCACAASPDAERARVRQSLANTRALGLEIQTWRRGLTGQPSSAVVQTIQDFQTRAQKNLDALNDASAPGTAGLDLTATKQALESLAKFDTSRFGDASDQSRNALLDQFTGLASSLEASAQRAQVHVG